MVTQNRFASLAPSLLALLPTLPGARSRWGPESERWVEPRATVGVGWHQPPSRSPAPPRPRGRRTGGEKARVLSRLLASYCVGASRIRLVIVSLARRPSSCLGLLSPPRTAFHSSPPEHAERASLGHSQAPRPPCVSREVSPLPPTERATGLWSPSPPFPPSLPSPPPRDPPDPEARVTLPKSPQS